MSLVRKSVVNAAIVSVIAGMGFAPANAATLSRSVEVQGSPSTVWAMIGPFCAIKDWLPPVGTCNQDGANTADTHAGHEGRLGNLCRAPDRTQRCEALLLVHLCLEPAAGHPLHVDHQGDVPGSRPVERDVARHLHTSPRARRAAAREALDGIYTAGLDSIRTQSQQRVAP